MKETENTTLKETCISSELIYDGKVVRLFVDRVSLPNGEESTREYVRHIGAVAVLPLTAEGEVICVRQYRYAIGRVTVEIPAGKLELGENDPEAAARRELSEEIGASAGKFTFLGTILIKPT